jgi:hydrogenase/urease accessory protein HupE
LRTVPHRALLTAFAIAVALSAARPAAAHPVPFSYLDLRLRDDAVEGSLVVHIEDAAYELEVDPLQLLDSDFAARQSADLTTLLAARFTVSADGRPLAPQWSEVKVLTGRQSLKLAFRFALDARPGRLAVSADMFPYDPRHQTFLNIYEDDELTQAILERGRTGFEYFAGTRRGSFSVVKKFLPAGIHHILIGPDHVLFLVGLLLLGGTFRRLALIVTGFTVAHSITLSLAALNLVTPPARIIEPAIALSIIFVGADNLLVNASVAARDIRAWVAFAFGFIHGFGFANVLREMELPPRALGWSLFAFNLGVEVGQLLVVAVVATSLAALRSRNEAAGRQLAFAGSVVVMAAGAFWFVQRVFFPGGMS